jgi:hypothetical protein
MLALAGICDALVALAPNRGLAVERRPQAGGAVRLPHLWLSSEGADPDEAVAALRRLGRVTVAIAQVAVELLRQVELALGLRTPPRLEQLPRRERRRPLYHGPNSHTELSD